MRTALGAGRSRLARQFLTESFVVTAIGSALGLFVAYWGSKLLVSKAPLSIPRASEIGIDGNVLLFLLGLSVVTAVIFGVLPALQMSRGMPIASLREGGRGTRGGLARRGLRQALVVSEVALAVVLVVGASLLVKSFWKMQRVDPGLRARPDARGADSAAAVALCGLRGRRSGPRVLRGSVRRESRRGRRCSRSRSRCSIRWRRGGRRASRSPGASRRRPGRSRSRASGR